MASIPTVKSIINNIKASYQATFGQAISILPKSFLYVTAKVLGGLYITLYKYAGFLGQQMFIRLASSKEITLNGVKVIPLIELGRQEGVTDPTDPVSAQYLIAITVTNQIGFLPSGSILVGEKNGVTYITIGSTALGADTVYATVKAVSDQSGGNGAGIIGNLDIGDYINFVNPLANVETRTIIDSQTITGVDGEDIDTVYRQRVLDRRQKPPQGGAYSDYELWAESRPGIINAYPYTGDIPGVVDTYIEASVSSSGNPDGFPTPAQIADVAAYIESVRPATAFVNILSITRLPFNVEVFDLEVDDIGLVKDDIEKALIQFFLSREPFIPGLSILPRADRVTRSAVGGIVQDVVDSFGGIFAGVSLKIEANPIEIYSLAEGEKAKLGVLSFPV